MKLFLALFLSLTFFGCGSSEDTPEALANRVINEKASGKVFTITHQTGNQEDVLISYKNPGNGIKAEGFRMLPGQCFEFTKTQFQFIKSIKFGVGANIDNVSVGNLVHLDIEALNLKEPYREICGSPSEENEGAESQEASSSAEEEVCPPLRCFS